MEDKLARRAAELLEGMLKEAKADNVAFSVTELILLEMIAALTVTVNELQDEVAAMMKGRA